MNPILVKYAKTGNVELLDGIQPVFQQFFRESDIFSILQDLGLAHQSTIHIYNQLKHQHELLLTESARQELEEKVKNRRFYERVNKARAEMREM